MTTVGLIVNPSAGRDIRRLTGGASVVDNYAKRRVAECVLDGLSVESGVEVLVMPDKAGIGEHAVEHAPGDLSVRLLDMEIEQSPADTRRAARRLEGDAAVVVVLGGDGTHRDVALELGDVPLVGVSTGTNNVVPTAVDGTVAGVGAGLVASGAVPAEAVTSRHGMVRARVDGTNGERTVTGIASVEISSRSFVGTRAVLDPSELVGGIVSRANPADIGLSGVAGALGSLSPRADEGVALRLTDPTEARRVVRAVVAPGMTARLGIESHRRVTGADPARIEVDVGVVGADGERELEVTDATVELAPVDGGPRLVSLDAVFQEAAGSGILADERVGDVT